MFEALTRTPVPPKSTLWRRVSALHNREQGKPGKSGETLDQLSGMAAFVHMTDPARGRVLLERLAALKAKQPEAT